MRGGSWARRSIAQREQDKTEQDQPAADPLAVQEDIGIFEKSFAHKGVHPQDRFGVREVSQAYYDQQNPQGYAEQEHVEKSIKIRREESMKGACYNAFVKLTSRHKERFKRTTRRIDGKAIGFRMDEIRLPDGRLRTREYITHPGAVGVLAFESPNKIILVKQFRYPVDEFTLEIPAGKLAKGEDPLHCVKRELEEETGFVAKKIRKLFSYWPTAAFSQEVIHLYVAEGLRPTQMNPDDDELIELVRVSPKELESLIRRGKIQDSKTLISFLAWRAL
jgi:ADP-ribose pyrophosphatase